MFRGNTSSAVRFQPRLHLVRPTWIPDGDGDCTTAVTHVRFIGKSTSRKKLEGLAQCLIRMRSCHDRGTFGFAREFLFDRRLVHCVFEPLAALPPRTDVNRAPAQQLFPEPQEVRTADC